MSVHWPRSPRVQDLALAVVAVSADVLFWGGLFSPAATGGDRLLVLLLALPEFGGLLLRRRHPAAAFLLLWALATGTAALTLHQDTFYFTPYLGFLTALFTVAERRRLPVAAGALLLSLAPMALKVHYVLTDQSMPGYELAALVSTLVFYLWLTTAAWAVARWTGANRAAAERDREELERARLAVVQERTLIARELHDVVANAVAVMVMRAEAGRAATSGPPAEAFGHIEEVGRSAVGELRRLLRLLRSTGLVGETQERRGLAELDQLLAGARRTGLEVELHTDGTPVRLAESVDMTVYRLVQEAVTNIAKHAGPGTRATVRLHWADTLRIEVTDDGAGRTPAARHALSTGHGLLGLAERIAVCGGELTAAPYHSGFRITATLPLG
ncbi:sensor histidine kinase [Kitasatospora sp. NPDC096147]|uniref:sensor histidine kinase n=1 Tax=Kitasatospora sp. NPDC096147 TaxID=3364093 RepID=UPI00382EC23D